MAMWVCEETKTTSAPPEAVWAQYASVEETWPVVNPDLKKAEIFGPFALGTKLRLSPNKGSSHKVKISELTENRSFTVSNPMPLARMAVEHDFIPEGEGTLIKMRVRFTGPLSKLWGKVVGLPFQKVLPDIVNNIAARAEAGA